ELSLWRRPVQLMNTLYSGFNRVFHSMNLQIYFKEDDSSMRRHALKETPHQSALSAADGKGTYRWHWYGLYVFLAILLVITPAVLVSADENDVPEDGVVSPDGERIAWISEDEQSV